jgi:hypothetical protein
VNSRHLAASQAVDSVDLKQALDDLEAEYQAGRLSESAYRDQRIRLKAALLDEIDRS